jgi:hypothetical protein
MRRSDSTPLGCHRPLARGSTPDVALCLFAPETRTNVMTIWCMRKTLHTLPLPLAVAAHSATLHFRERDALRAVMNANMSTSAVSRVTDAIVALLEHDGPLFHREIETRLTGRRMTVVAVRLALKLAWELPASIWPWTGVRPPVSWYAHTSIGTAQRPCLT